MTARQPQPFTVATDGQTTPDIVAPMQPGFRVDPIEAGGPYIDNSYGAWAPELGEVIDRNRVQGRAPVFIDPRNVPNARTNEETDADGWMSVVTRRSYGDDPRWHPSTDFRPTGLMSPSRWRYFRPFGKRFATIFDGTHFSFASYRRNYDIAGMKPAIPNRNTQRIEPKPWDNDIVDGPATANNGLPYSRNPGNADILPGRSFRAQ